MKKILIASWLLAILFGCKKPSQPETLQQDATLSAGASDRTVAPSILQWQKCLGSSADDLGYSITKASDGTGYFVTGYTTGIDGSKDAIVVKIALDNTFIWQTIIRGSQWDEGSGIIATPDGGCLVAGYTASNDGDIIAKGGSDVLLFKLLPNGDKEWVTTLGGSGHDRAFALINTLDGGYALAGETTSIDGDVTQSQVINGNAKVWLVKFNITTGAAVIEWQKTIGVTNTKGDVGYSLAQASNGDYIIAGRTMNLNTDPDILILNTDVNGILKWSKTIVSTAGDVAFGVAVSPDFGYLVTGYYYVNNLLAVKLDATGQQLWQKTFTAGTANSIHGRSIISSTDGVVITGSTNSKNGEIIATKGGQDMFVLRLDNATGNKISSHVLGGKGNDVGRALILTQDGMYLAAGYTTSNNGDVSGNHGLSDFWVVKFKF